MNKEDKNKLLNIAIIGTRGIPNNYGGFEQFTEYLSVGLAQKGHKMTVYSPHFHLYKEKSYKYVEIKHIYSPEHIIGSALGNCIYDFLCLRDALNQKYDIIYEAGFTSIVPSYIYFDIKKIDNPVIVTNVDGLEWKRNKFNTLTRKFMLWEEKIVSRYCKYLVADNKGIQKHFKDTYRKDSFFLSYGANIHTNYSEEYLKKYNLRNKSYYLIIARLEPENNIEIIVNGYLSSVKFLYPLVIVGNTNTSYGKYLTRKYKNYSHIRFLGGIFNFDELESIRHYAFSYFHGHSVGGTNPSLLEAMAAGCLIIAHDNSFNRSILHNNAFFFLNESDITTILNSNTFNDIEIRKNYILNNLNSIVNDYSWEKIIRQHEIFFYEILGNNKFNEISVQ
jgi:glycosyltransferase involved in cell wall biosynthesis